MENTTAVDVLVSDCNYQGGGSFHLQRWLVVKEKTKGSKASTFKKQTKIKPNSFNNKCQQEFRSYSVVLLIWKPCAIGWICKWHFWDLNEASGNLLRFLKQQKTISLNQKNSARDNHHGYDNPLFLVKRIPFLWKNLMNFFCGGDFSASQRYSKLKTGNCHKGPTKSASTPALDSKKIWAYLEDPFQCQIPRPGFVERSSPSLKHTKNPDVNGAFVCRIT